jgi:phosphate transport system permease protein
VTAVSAIPATQVLGGTRRLRDRLGDRLLFLLTLLASLLAIGAMIAIAYKVFRGAWPAIQDFGLSFLTSSAWDVNKATFGALPGLYGTAITSFLALFIAGPLAIAIVVLGLWGILVLGPFVAAHVEPWLSKTFGFIPIFSGDPNSSGIFIAVLVLAIMIVPIVASICRELFLAVPRELEEGALALGATRWEMVRGVVLSSSRPGIAAALILGLGRALGEAIAVTQVIGAGWWIHKSLYDPGDTLASRIAAQFQGAQTKEQTASLFYLAAILLVIGLVTNLAAQLIVRRFDVHRAGAR